MPKISVKSIGAKGSAAVEEPASSGEPMGETVSETLESPQLLVEEDEAAAPQPVSPRQARLKPTPEPPYYKFHSDNPRGRRPNDFFSYWSSLASEFRERLTVYIYRNWPVIAVMVPDKKRGGLKPTCQIAKIPGEDAIRDEDHLMRRFGSGDYTIRLNDATVRKSIALCVIKGLRGGEDHPPVIESYDHLVMDDPANQSFIEGLRQKGALQGENEMAAGEVVAGLTGTIERLSNRLTEKGNEPAPAPAQSATDTAKATVEMAGEVFKQGIALGQASVEAQADAKVKAAEAQVAAANPMSSFDTLTKLVDLVKGMQPPVKPETPSAATGMAEAVGQIAAIYNSVLERESKLHGTIMAMMDSRVQGLERLIQERAVNPAAAPAQKDDLISNLDKLAGMKDKLQALFGGGESDEKEEKVPAWMNLAQSAMSGLPNIATALLGMSYNMAIAKTGSGVPIPPGPIENPALPPAPDNPNPTSGEKPMAANVYATFLSQIERPLINHLNDPTKTGADFADWVSSGFGDIGYQAAKELGKDTLLALLASRPSIASVIQQIPERTAQFIDEFLTADEMPDEGNDEPSEGVRTFVAPPRGNPQVIDVPPIVRVQEGARPRRKVAPAAG